VPLDVADTSRCVRIVATLFDKQESALVSFLTDNRDVFAKKPADMLGILTEIDEHALNIQPTARPVAQRLRRFDKEKRKAIGEEVAKLLATKFIWEIHHSMWVANPILVKKKNGSRRMCVDYTSLNKACPKDPFPLPRINQVVDSTTGTRGASCSPY
jgi:hypothetical protein